MRSIYRHLASYINKHEIIVNMVKLIGMLLIATSILLLFASIFIGMKYGSNVELTGNVVSNIIQQPEVNLGFFDYLQAITLSYSVLSFIVGIVFLVRFDKFK